MGQKMTDGTIRLSGGKILFANSLVEAGDLPEILEVLLGSDIDRVPRPETSALKQSAEGAVPMISDADFRTALNEAHWLMSKAIDQETAARMRRQSRVGVAGATSRAEVQARELAIRRRDEILWLMAGMLGRHLPQDNAAALKRAKELCKLAKERKR